MANVDPRLLNVILTETPAIVAFAKELFAKAHPDAPQPTDADVHAAFESTFSSSLARDESLLAEPQPPQSS